MDGAHVRGLARLVREAAQGVRAAGDRLSAANSTHWRSVAAEEFRARLVTERGRVLVVASRLDEAVLALCRHSAVLEGRHG